MNGSVENVNKVYRDCVDRMVEGADGKDKLGGLFEEWFRNCQ